MDTPDPSSAAARTRVLPPFRREALEAQHGGWLGEISLVRPLSSWLLTGAAVLVAAVVVALFAFGRYAERSRVTGELQPVHGLTTLYSPALGAVERVLVEEGALVKRGDLLVVLGHPRSAPDAPDASALQRDLLATRGSSLDRSLDAELALLDGDEVRAQAQLDGLVAELRGLQRELDLRREQLAGLDDVARRFEALGESGHAGALQVREAQGRVLAQRADIEALQRELAKLEARRHDAEQSLASVTVRRSAARSAHQRDKATLAQEDVELALQARSAIRAPFDGVVAARLAEPGLDVAPGKALLLLMSVDDALEAHLYVPSRAIAGVQPGAAVRLRYPAYPYQRYGHFGGRVLRVSQAALRRTENGAGESTYRVVVALDAQRVAAFGRSDRLMPGMAVEADLFGEPRRLIEWLLGPLRHLGGEVADH